MDLSGVRIYAGRLSVTDLQIIAGFSFLYVTAGLGINLWFLARQSKAQLSRIPKNRK